MPSDVETSAGLPRGWYCEGEPFQQEKRSIFATQWLLLGRTDHLQEPGEFTIANLGGWPVFALVDAARAIGAFRNVCRHQGMQVLEKPRGRCESVRCRYHGWTYDLAGRMIAAPELVAPADPASEDNHLCRIASAAWQGLLFVNLDRNAMPLIDALAALARCGDAAMARHSHWAGEITTDFNCNWKTYVEHRLAAPAPDVPASDDATWHWQWPLSLLRIAPSATSVIQVIPRTFARTRVIEHVRTAAAAKEPAVLAAVADARARAAIDKIACEARQREHEAGLGYDDAGLAAFHQQVREAHARAPVAEALRLQQGVA